MDKKSRKPKRKAEPETLSRPSEESLELQTCTEIHDDTVLRCHGFVVHPPTNGVQVTVHYVDDPVRAAKLQQLVAEMLEERRAQTGVNGALRSERVERKVGRKATRPAVHESDRRSGQATLRPPALTSGMVKRKDVPSILAELKRRAHLVHSLSKDDDARELTRMMLRLIPSLESLVEQASYNSQGSVVGQTKAIDGFVSTACSFASRLAQPIE